MQYRAVLPIAVATLVAAGSAYAAPPEAPPGSYVGAVIQAVSSNGECTLKVRPDPIYVAPGAHMFWVIDVRNEWKDCKKIAKLMLKDFKKNGQPSEDFKNCSYQKPKPQKLGLIECDTNGEDGADYTYAIGAFDNQGNAVVVKDPTIRVRGGDPN